MHYFWVKWFIYIAISVMSSFFYYSPSNLSCSLLWAALRPLEYSAFSVSYLSPPSGSHTEWLGYSYTFPFSLLSSPLSFLHHSPAVISIYFPSLLPFPSQTFPMNLLLLIHSFCDFTRRWNIRRSVYRRRPTQWNSAYHSTRQQTSKQCIGQISCYPIICGVI